MRFKEFLLREDGELGLIPGLVKIKEQCSEFLNDVQGTDEWIYRGMYEEPEAAVFRKNHLVGRDPRDSSLGFNTFFNTGVELAFKIPMVRFTSVFMTGDRGETVDYGEMYFVFPTSNYKYIWSDTISDSYNQEDSLYQEFLGQLDLATTTHTRDIQEVFKTIATESGSIKRAVDNMKTNDEMIERAFKTQDITTTAEDVDRALAKTFKRRYMANDGLRDAIRSKNEILMYASDGIYYIPRELIKFHISERPKLEGQSPEEFLTNYFWGPGA